MTVYRQIWSKKLNCIFKLKFGISPDWNMLDFMMTFTFPVLEREKLFFRQIWSKTSKHCTKNEVFH